MSGGIVSVEVSSVSGSQPHSRVDKSMNKVRNCNLFKKRAIIIEISVYDKMNNYLKVKSEF
tara:strand:+ start:40159 stop:40341 length:183 start_codon:yes stop_codon:yes gene_type:complete